MQYMLTACSVIYGSDDSNQNNRIDSSGSVITRG